MSEPSTPSAQAHQSTPLSVPRDRAAPMDWIAWIIISVAGILGAIALAAGTWHALNSSHDDQVNTSAAMDALFDTGNDLQTAIGRTVQPAIVRTETLAKSPELIRALSSGDSAAQTAVLNSKITEATEIDAIALFNSSGRISAINTLYANGRPIAKARVNQIMGTDFSQRSIIQNCLNNRTSAPALEFQTHCDITPAFFDSTGLSVAYSVPVINPRDGTKLGVVSTRLRFERLSSLIEERTIAQGSARAYFITDAGGYFSESINSGRDQPPVPVPEVRDLVRPMLDNAMSKAVSKRGDKYLAIFPLPSFRTLDGGGLHILIVADGDWLTQDPRNGRMIHAAGLGFIGVLLLIVGGLVYSGVTQRNARRKIREVNETNAQLRQYQVMIFNAIDEGIHWIDRDGRIVFENPAAVRLLGWESAELIGRPAHVITHRPGNGRVPDVQRDCPIYRGLETGVTHREDNEVFWRKDATAFPVEYTTTPMRDKNNRIIGAVVVFTDITERKRGEAERDDLNRQLLTASRRAGMAEVATGILHNVGNVLNSVNVSAHTVSAKVRTSRLAGLGKAAAMMLEHADDLASFLTADQKGRQLPDYFQKLAEHMGGERAEILSELDLLTKNITHINQIVSMQQTNAKVFGVVECVSAESMVEDALRINQAALDRHHVGIVRGYEAAPPVTVDRHKVLQILVNLISNAKHAMDATSPGDRVLTLRVGSNETDQLRIEVTDNGAGISPENMERIFTQGFTTRKDGHGFGLHSAILAARDMGGSLTARSEGLGHGATFILELPLEPALASTAESL